MNEQPPQVTAEDARAARARAESATARRAARERDRSESPAPPEAHTSSYKQFKFRSSAKQYAECSLGANGSPGIVKANAWPGWRLRRQAIADDLLPPAEEADRTDAPDDGSYDPGEAARSWERVRDAELDRARTPPPRVLHAAPPPAIPTDGSFLETMKRRFARAPPPEDPAEEAPIANDGSFFATMTRRFANARARAPATRAEPEPEAEAEAEAEEDEEDEEPVATPPDDVPYPVDTLVEARWHGGARFYPALVVATGEATVDLKYCDGEEEAGAPLAWVRPLAAAPPPSPQAAEEDASDAPAPAPEDELGGDAVPEVTVRSSSESDGSGRPPPKKRKRRKPSTPPPGVAVVGARVETVADGAAGTVVTVNAVNKWLKVRLDAAATGALLLSCRPADLHLLDGAVSAPPSPPEPVARPAAPHPPAPVRPRSRDPSPGQRSSRPSELFAQDNRAAVRAEHPGDPDAVKNRLREMWRSVDDATRKSYVERARTLRERARSASRDDGDDEAAAPAPAPTPAPRVPKHGEVLPAPAPRAPKHGEVLRAPPAGGGRLIVGAVVEAAPHAFGANFVRRVGTEARYRGTIVERGADDVVDDGLRNSLTDRVWRVRFDDDGLIWATPERFLSVVAPGAAVPPPPAPAPAEEEAPAPAPAPKPRGRPRKSPVASPVAEEAEAPAPAPKKPAKKKSHGGARRGAAFERQKAAAVEEALASPVAEEAEEAPAPAPVPEAPDAPDAPPEPAPPPEGPPAPKRRRSYKKAVARDPRVVAGARVRTPTGARGVVVAVQANGWVTVRLDVAMRLSRGVKRERGFRGNELRPLDGDDYEEEEEEIAAALPNASDDEVPAGRTAEELAVLEAEDLGRDVMRPPQPAAAPRPRVAAGDGTATYVAGDRVQVLHFKGKPTGVVVAPQPPGYDIRLDHSGIVWPLSAAVLVPGAPDTPPRLPSPPSSPEPSPDYRARRTLPTGRAPPRPPTPPIYRLGAAARRSWVPERVEEIAWT